MMLKVKVVIIATAATVLLPVGVLADSTEVGNSGLSADAAQAGKDNTQAGKVERVEPVEIKSLNEKAPQVAVHNPKAQKLKTVKLSFIRKMLAPVTDLQTQSIRLQEQIIRLERPIEDLRPSIGMLPDRVSSLESDMTSLRTNMVSIKDELSAVHGDMNVVEKQIGRLEKPIGGLEKPISALQDPVTRLYKPMIDLQPPIASLHQEIGDFKKQVSELRDQTKLLIEPISSISQPMSQLQGPMRELPKPITEVRAQLVDLKAQLSELQTAINKTTCYVIAAILLASIMIAIGTPLVAFLLWRKLSQSSGFVSGKLGASDPIFADQVLRQALELPNDSSAGIDRSKGDAVSATRDLGR